MTANRSRNHCQFCSEISKANGHDPIGSAWQYDRWFIIEMPQPWERSSWQEHPILHPIYHDLIKPLHDEHGLWIRPLLIAPDRAYSIPDKTRILYYHRPAGLFAQFEKQEFIVPTEQILSLATALLQQPDQLPHFAAYQQQTKHIRELMVCTHGTVDVACARFGFPIYERLRNDHAANSGGRLRVWRCSHFGGHVFAPTLVDLPEGRYWGHLEPEILDSLVHHNGSVADLRSFYRGWCGLKQFEQIAEREIWMQEGWKWLNYLKRGETIAIAPTHNDDEEPDWAEVRIEYASPDGNDIGVYEARIEVCGTVMTQWQSGNDQPVEETKQYRVSQLVQQGAMVKKSV
ncbi:sucrase ferredoxin [Myxacorys almedinensis]|uniref:Sucrase ferredoxin n=1 Tax=Myxacorys almedinensis A TaxID=2690445 RepID=A0A8J7Z1H1_9CYAN|nr:sucrase ferredoxin [Myxacorys almedinensis]NDJ17919.1 sucrase ferredoxin [Myxacorys almedinensis A]